MPVIKTIKLEVSGIIVEEFTDGSILLEWEGRTIPTSKIDISRLYYMLFPHAYRNATDNDDDDINTSAKSENETQDYFNRTQL